MFDHTTVIAEDDPTFRTYFRTMDREGIIQLRVIPATGAEKFAEYIFTIN